MIQDGNRKAINVYLHRHIALCLVGNLATLLVLKASISHMATH